jgi:hypothetical protein
MTEIPGTQGPRIKSTREIKAAVRTMGETLLLTSVEKKLVLERVDGTGGAGFFYHGALAAFVFE